jgi:hypothetical protein
MTEYEKQKKEEDTKIPVANTKLSHETRSDLKARL